MRKEKKSGRHKEKKKEMKLRVLASAHAASGQKTRANSTAGIEQRMKEKRVSVKNVPLQPASTD